MFVHLIYFATVILSMLDFAKMSKILIAAVICVRKPVLPLLQNLTLMSRI